MGTELGYEGEALQTVMKEQQELDRAERAKQREDRIVEEEQRFSLKEIEASKEKLAMEIDFAHQQGEEAQREYERKLEIIKYQQGLSKIDPEITQESGGALYKYIPKLPPYDGLNDDMDAYLRRFETFTHA